MTDFKREERYFVIKKKRIDDVEIAALIDFLQSWQIPTENCVVVEHDWSIYERVWGLVEGEAGRPLKNMPLPNCMLPDGAPPCDQYAELFERARKLETAVKAISPWLSASLSCELSNPCDEYKAACDKVFEVDK